jgi:hypothetical protein
VRKLPNGKLVAKFVLETSRGPLVLDAVLEGVTARAAADKIVGRNEFASGDEILPEAGPSLAGGPHGGGHGGGGGGHGGGGHGGGHHGGGGHHHHHHGGGGWGGWRGGVLYTGPTYYDEGPLYVPVPVESEEVVYVVATGGPALTLRSSPGGADVGSLPNGSTFYVSTIDRGFAHGRSATSGAVGFADARFLRRAASTKIAGIAGAWSRKEEGLSDLAGASARRHVRGARRVPPTPSDYSVYQSDMARLRAHAVQIEGEAALPKHGNAERLYAKVLERDPRAPAAVRQILLRAQNGDPDAMATWAGMCNAKARAKAGDFTTATAREKAAADRLYLRFRRGDAPAVAEVQKIVALAQQGDVGAIRARGLLCLRHESDKGAALAGASLELSPQRVAELLQIVMRARFAAPPAGYYGQASPFFSDEEPPVMGPMPLPGAPTGKMAQYLAAEEAAKTAARASAITAIGPTAVSSYTFKPAASWTSAVGPVARSLRG